MNLMRWTDRVYGDTSIADPDLLRLIGCPTFQRLKGIRQAGPSALAFPFKDVTRFEHSLGVFVLLRKLGADRREQVAGLLHDISHTAFSHAVDFVFASDEQNHHERIKHHFLSRPDLAAPLEAMGYSPGEFEDDDAYPLLERPLPWLCADRLDYFFRDSLACDVTTPAEVRRMLDALAVAEGMIVFTDETASRLAVRRFAEMNRDWWASDTEAYIYNEFADALREGIRIGAIVEDDLLEDDAFVLTKLRASGNSGIVQTLDRLSDFNSDWAEGYVPKVIPKQRWLDPHVLIGAGYARLSECC
jgi:HD superfamily phosphohydrolase